MEQGGSSEKKSSGNRKRLLFISLFIVPFLAGMALIFIGKNIATLPTLYPIGQEQIDGKLLTTYYQVPDFSFVNLEGDDVFFHTKTLLFF